MSADLKNFEVQYLSNQATDHPGSYTFFRSFFHILSGYNICFQNCITSNMTKFESHEQTPSKSICQLTFQQPFPKKYTILMLHIIPNRKLHTYN